MHRPWLIFPLVIDFWVRNAKLMFRLQYIKLSINYLRLPEKQFLTSQERRGEDLCV
jgi:hypothetical protein